MKKQPLGQTGLHVTPIGLGLAALGRPGYINLGHSTDLQGDYALASMQTHSHAILDAAWNAGVRYFDAARSYGKAEMFLGAWLQARTITPEQVTIGSKWGYTYTADWQVEAEYHEIKEHSLTVLQRQWAESQHHLGAYLDLYQIHSATLDSGVLSNSDVLSALIHLKQQGVAIGLSTSGTNQAVVIDKATQLTIDGMQLFDCVQVTWNLLERTATAALTAAHAAGLGIIVKEAVANGRLTSRGLETLNDQQRQAFLQQTERLNTTPDALALAGVLAQPWVDVVLSGATTHEQLTANLQALHVPWDAEASAALATLAEPAKEYWALRKALPWN